MLTTLYFDKIFVLLAVRLKTTAIKYKSAGEPETANFKNNFRTNLLMINILNLKRNGNQRDAFKQLVQRLRWFVMRENQCLVLLAYYPPYDFFCWIENLKLAVSVHKTFFFEKWFWNIVHVNSERIFLIFFLWFNSMQKFSIKILEKLLISVLNHLLQASHTLY